MVDSLRRHAVPVAITGIVAVACAFAVFVIATAHADSVFLRPPPPAPGGAFATGGAPTHDLAVERALTELAALVADGPRADRWAVAHLRDDDAMRAHGVDQAGAWRSAIDTLAAWRPRAADAPGYARLTAELTARLEVVTDQLAAAGLGYYVHPELARGAVSIYRVDDVTFVRAARERIRVLGVRRVDRVGAAGDGAVRLGMKVEELGDPVVLLDSIDDKVSAQILPVLAGRPFPLGDRGSPAVARAAGDAIRAELLTALGPDASDPGRAAQRCFALLAASVGRHEAQHAFDEAHGLDAPAALGRLVHEPEGSPMSLRARFELSAYLSQLASDVWLPQLVLWNLARHALHDTPTRTAEQLVAVAVTESVAARLGIAAPGPVLHAGAIDHDRLAALLVAIASRSTAELRSAAAAAWGDLFRGKLPRLVSDP